MGFEKQQAYLSLKKEICACRDMQANLLIITLPGTGMGRFMKEIATDLKIKYIGDVDQDLEAYNLVNFDWVVPNVLEKVENIFKKCSFSQKIAVSINYPNLLVTEDLKNSFFINHTYKKYFFGLRNRVDTELLIDEIKPKLSKKEKDEIFKLSGGLAQLVKFLIVNGMNVTDGFDGILQPVLKAVEGVDETILEKLGIRKSGDWQGKLLADMVKNENPVGIKVNFDLSFEEDNQLNSNKLTLGEKMVLEKMVVSGGRMTKEDVAQVKWGDIAYDENFDRAINKQMRRLSEKLTKYTIETVPKVGFILKRR